MEQDLDSLKLRDSVQKYNEEVAGWKQIQIKFLSRKDIPTQLEKLSDDFSTGILKNIEDFLFVN